MLSDNLVIAAESGSRLPIYWAWPLQEPHKGQYKRLPRDHFLFGLSVLKRRIAILTNSTKFTHTGVQDLFLWEVGKSLKDIGQY